jgi:hypothetical protein
VALQPGLLAAGTSKEKTMLIPATRTIETIELIQLRKIEREVRCIINADITLAATDLADVGNCLDILDAIYGDWRTMAHLDTEIKEMERVLHPGNLKP